jgi:hypothetical protein
MNPIHLLWICPVCMAIGIALFVIYVGKGE